MENKVDAISSRKKLYTKPQMINHGDVEDLTRTGGGSHLDVPNGTNLDPPGDISSVTS